VFEAKKNMLNRTLIKKSIAKEQNFINCKNNNKQKNLIKTKKFKLKKQITKVINRKYNILLNI